METENMKDMLKYNESNTPQNEQKHKGWYWHSERKEFYRWDNYPKHTK